MKFGGVFAANQRAQRFPMKSKWSSTEKIGDLRQRKDLFRGILEEIEEFFSKYTHTHTY